MQFIIDALIEWPRRTAAYLTWLGPLFARITVGWVFLWTGLGKLQSLDFVTNNFVEWGIPLPSITAPFVSGLEFFGGIFLVIGLLTRIAAGGLGVTMIVATISAKLADIDWSNPLAASVGLLGFDEIMYLAMFLWLAIHGAGRVSIDYFLEKPSQDAASRLPQGALPATD